jgi:CubicO group peptidase (beta-lactamase class C family)
MAVLHRDELVFEDTLGWADVSGEQPMAPETVFRIYSMTKPLTSVAVMQLVERGELALDTPVAEYFPELAELRALTGEGELTEPLAHPLTVLHLLTHTSGFTYGFLAEPRLARRYSRARLEAEGDDARAHVRKLAQLPLVSQPGTRWQYGRSTDVLGALVEAVSGLRLDAYFEQHITGPLGMEHTGFVVAQGDAGRLARLYQSDGAGGLRLGGGDSWDPDPSFCSGGGGLVSTLGDYLRFCRCLAAGGELDGVRLLQAETVARMTRDHIAGLPRPRMLSDRGFGLGFAILTEESAGPLNGAVGGYHWSGMGGTSFFVDPGNELVAVFLVQAWNDFSFMTRFRKAVYAAVLQSGSEVGDQTFSAGTETSRSSSAIQAVSSRPQTQPVSSPRTRSRTTRPSRAQ